LDTLIKENELSKTQQLLIASGFLQQVYLLQQNNIVHGDIQPGNCITEVDEQSVQAGLIGFRYSHILPEGQTTLTVTDYDVKTPYTAPEVSTEGKYSFASDIYALGVLLTEDLDLQLDPTSNREQQLILMIKAMVKSDPAQRPALITVLNQLITVLPRQADYVPDPHEETNYAKIKLEAALVAKKPMSANVNAENAEPATEIAALVGNTYIPLASRATLSALAHTRCESNGGLDPRNGNDHTNQRPTINN
jgi:serine/threonine protein kinase